jgi:hypothetical protein
MSIATVEEDPVEFLSEEWMAERLRLAATGPTGQVDVSMRLQHIVIGGPKGTVRYFDEVVAGTLVRCGLGDIDSPHVTITNQWEDELAVLRGEADPVDILMAGRVTVEGDQSRLLMLAPVLTSQPAGDVVKSLANVTDA